MGEIISGFVAGFVIALWTVFSWLDDTNLSKYADTIEKAVEQCEQHLPRNKHCEPVISAKIVEE